MMALTIMRHLVFGSACLGLLYAGALRAAGDSSADPFHADHNIVLRIGDERFDRAQYRDLLNALSASRGVTMSAIAPDETDLIVKSYAQSHILAERARAEHLDRDSATAARLNVQADLILAEAERQKLMREAIVDEQAVQQRFAERPGDYDEYHLRHIFIAIHWSGGKQGKEQAELQALERARALKARLNAGADFDQLARTESDDHATSAEGGQLSAMFGQYLADEFAPAVRALKEGEVSEPILGPGGYHLIRLDSRRVADYSHVRPMIEAQLRSEAVDASIASILQSDTATVDRHVPTHTAVLSVP